MATRRLSRTIVEGGKHGSDKFQRKLQIQKDRRIARDFCKTYFDEDDIESEMYIGKQYYREFNDRLRPLYKWMSSHVGIRWDIVYSKLCAIRSRNCIQGHHFIEHAKGMIYTGPDKISSGFYLENGILREIRPSKIKRPSSKKLRKLYKDWIGNRKVKQVGSKYFWYNPVRLLRPLLDGSFAIFVSAWRQGLPLTAKEVGHMEWIKERDARIWNAIVGA